MGTVYRKENPPQEEPIVGTELLHRRRRKFAPVNPDLEVTIADFVSVAKVSDIPPAETREDSLNGETQVGPKGQLRR